MLLVCGLSFHLCLGSHVDDRINRPCTSYVAVVFAISLFLLQVNWLQRSTCDTCVFAAH